MKHFIESFVTAVLLVTIIFAIVSLMTAQTELMAARETHSQLLQAVQTSDASTIDDLAYLNEQLNNSVRAKHKKWYVVVSKLESANSRDYYMVSLNYVIDIPLFGKVATGKIDGYAK